MICDVGVSRGASRSETDVVEVVLSQRDNKAGSTLNLIRTAPMSQRTRKVSSRLLLKFTVVGLYGFFFQT